MTTPNQIQIIYTILSYFFAFVQEKIQLDDLYYGILMLFSLLELVLVDTVSLYKKKLLR
jgi:hypothetical protein